MKLKNQKFENYSQGHKLREQVREQVRKQGRKVRKVAIQRILCVFWGCSTASICLPQFSNHRTSNCHFYFIFIPVNHHFNWSMITVCIPKEQFDALMSFQRQNPKHQKRKFLPQEDRKLIFLVNKYGTRDWNLISEEMKTRNARQCRERWNYYLSPSVSTSAWTDEEDEQLISMHKQFGSKWVFLTRFFPSRTDSQIKNRFKILKRREVRMRLESSSAISETSSECENDIDSDPPHSNRDSCDNFLDRITGTVDDIFGNLEPDELELFGVSSW